MGEKENLKTLEHYIRSIHNKDKETLYGLIHDDYVEEYPQSGERIKGKANFKNVYDNFPNLPSVEGYNLFCSGDLGVVEMLLDYPDGGTYNTCEVVHFKDGKIAHTRMYFGKGFEAADWRSDWVETIGESTEETYENRPSARA